MPDCPTVAPVEQGINGPIVHYEVQIVKVANGFVCRVGCKTFVAKTWDELAVGLELYWRNPNEARKQYCKDEVIA